MPDGVIDRRYEVHCASCGDGCLHLMAKTQRDAETELRKEGWGQRGKLWHCGGCMGRWKDDPDE